MKLNLSSYHMYLAGPNSQEPRCLEVHYTVLSTFICLEIPKIKGFKIMKKHIHKVFSVREVSYSFSF